MRNALILITSAFLLASAGVSRADQKLLETHCSKCHNDEKTKGKFNLRSLGNGPNAENGELWVTSLNNIEGLDMPPEDESELSVQDRERLIQFLKQKISDAHQMAGGAMEITPRRLNNRELIKSVADVLLIEDVGTHFPTADLVGDALNKGFDTDAETLGISQFQMEQYIVAFRKILDATIFSTGQPATQKIEVKAGHITLATTTQQKTKQRKAQQRRELPDREYLDFGDIRSRLCLSNFLTAPATGRYRITIRATGVDRGIYATSDTGIYKDDPIRLAVHLGDRVHTFDLPDEKVMEIELDEWIAAGTSLQMSYPTDGLRMRGNSNFKFQYAIAGEYIKEHDPKRYAQIVANLDPKKKGAGHWSNWVEYWQGPRPRLFSAEIEGPIYDAWPPKRQVALLGENPTAENAAAILELIAERAWRRKVREGELDSIVQLVQASAPKLGDIEALKEGIVAVLASPSFLLINSGESDAAERFATKLSYLMKSTTPDARLQQLARAGELKTFEAVREEVQRQFSKGEAAEFLSVFPYEWLQLDRINFMAPDPVQFLFYDKKRVSEDMIAEVRAYFRHAIEHNVPVPELLISDYSFVNADLARIYGIDDVPQDSKLRKHTFADGKRGGFIGMGAFLTLTADSLSTSPIHRAVYVMENFFGIHPLPPPPNVKITEPDVRQAKTIKQVLAAHQSDENCASCHKSIDPWGYAFESFDPSGAWRDFYTVPKTEVDEVGEAKAPVVKKREATKAETIPIDASAKFRNGAEYHDIISFRKYLFTDTNRDRFVRCFITKLLTYANGVAPGEGDYVAIDKILAKSAANGHRVIDTIAAVIDSPLFREE